MTHLATITNKNNNNPPNVAQSQKHPPERPSIRPKLPKKDSDD